MTTTPTIDLREVPGRVTFLVPPRNQGQIVEVSYADLYDGTVLRRTIDRSDRSTTYDVATLDDDSPAPSGLNAEPSVTDDWTPCRVIGSA